MLSTIFYHNDSLDFLFLTLIFYYFYVLVQSIYQEYVRNSHVNLN